MEAFRIPNATGLGHFGVRELPLLADLNGDGRPDVVSYFSNPNPGRAVAVLPSTPTGFGPITTNQVGGGRSELFHSRHRSR